jgi:hypothetical protein
MTASGAPDRLQRRRWWKLMGRVAVVAASEELYEQAEKCRWAPVGFGMLRLPIHAIGYCELRVRDVERDVV